MKPIIRTWQSFISSMTRSPYTIIRDELPSMLAEIRLDSGPSVVVPLNADEIGALIGKRLRITVQIEVEE